MLPRLVIFLVCTMALFNSEGSRSAVSSDPMDVVVSFSILEDLARELGGSRVSVQSLVPADSDPHIYQPRPSDIGKISRANLIIINGLHFEGWISRLIDSAGYTGLVIIASAGITPRISHDVIDPHAWQSTVHIRQYVDNITNAFIDYQPDHRSEFTHNRNKFLSEVAEFEQDVTQRLSTIPRMKRKVVTSHDAFGYLGEQFDIDFLAPTGIGTDSDVKASGVVSLIKQIRKHQISAVFVENIADSRLLQQIGSETGIELGGRLYSDALSPSGGPADTYLNMMQHNLNLIIEALSVNH